MSNKTEWFFMSAAGVALILFVLWALRQQREADSPVYVTQSGVRSVRSAAMMYPAPVQPWITKSDVAPADSDGCDGCGRNKNG